jgi:hypothetical protein
MKQNIIPISQITTCDYEELDLLHVRGGEKTEGGDTTYSGLGCNTDYHKCTINNVAGCGCEQSPIN